MLVLAIAALAAALTMALYETFLFLIRSVFIPLFGSSRPTRSSRAGDTLIFPGCTKCAVATGYTRGLRLRDCCRWWPDSPSTTGVQPDGPAWWVDFVTGLIGTPLGGHFAWLPTSLPRLESHSCSGFSGPARLSFEKRGSTTPQRPTQRGCDEGSS